MSSLAWPELRLHEGIRLTTDNGIDVSTGPVQVALIIWLFFATSYKGKKNNGSLKLRLKSSAEANCRAEQKYQTKNHSSCHYAGSFFSSINVYAETYYCKSQEESGTGLTLPAKGLKQNELKKYQQSVYKVIR